MRSSLVGLLLSMYSLAAFSGIDLLAEAAKTTDFLTFNPDSKDEFNTKSEYLGELNEMFKLYNHTYYFNNNSRAGHRLVILSKSGELIGMYAVNDWAISIGDECIYFPNAQYSVNKICLDNGSFPERAWVDGELSLLFK